MRTRNIAIAVLTGATACCVLTGCYDPNEIKDFLLKPRAPVSGTEYRVLPPDVITITSRQVPEIASVTQRIRPDGKINLPLLGEVYVANMTPREIEETLKKKASKYYEQVDATVTVSAYLSQAFYVFGQVNRQGPQPWTGRDTLLDALALLPYAIHMSGPLYLVCAVLLGGRFLHWAWVLYRDSISSSAPSLSTR